MFRVPIGLEGAASALAQIDEEFQLRNSDASAEGGWCKACDMPVALRQWLDKNKGFDDFHGGAWCRCLDALPLMDM
eukprot:COSAG02_NODE_6158_length_3757_cov_2.795790_5_plen_76_part_00